MTGDLYLSKEGVPSYFAQNLNTNREFYIEHTTDSYVVIANRPIGGGVGKRTALWLAPESVDVNNLFRLVKNNDGVQSIYNILHSGNYTNFVPTKTGSGASGTWEISITGSANKLQGLSRLTTAEEVDAFLEGDIVKWAKINAEPMEGNDGLLMSFGWSADFGAQMWLDDGGNEGGMKIRNRSSAGGWHPWRKVLTEANYSDIINAKFLPLTGGTITGTVKFPGNMVSLNFRPDNGDYHTTISYQTTGNEAMVFATKQSVTSFIFVNGEDSITNLSAARWKSLTPGLQIKYNCVSIGELIPDGTNPSYKLKVKGTSCFQDGMLRVNGAPIFGYVYSKGSNLPAFVWDKNGANYTGMGANGTADTIYFGAVYSSDYTWNTSYRQKWQFNGGVYSTPSTDYAEIRFRNTGAGTGSAPSSLGNGEMWVKY